MDSMIWAYLIHLSFNMWTDREAPEWGLKHACAKPHLRCDSELWGTLVERMVAAGINMAVIDVGDGVLFESHPEIAVRHAWSPKRLRRELAKLRKVGIEPIPKLNFSTAHDAWLGPYARCVSTDTYYAVCRDLIAEVIDLFEKPRFFHLGMDEETAEHQRFHGYSVIRQHELWWHDLYFLLEQAEKGGARPWVWSDYVWHHPEVFFKKMPRSVLQSNWYYAAAFSKRISYVKAYLDLEAHGYDQVPTGSNWSSPDNFGSTVEYCQKHIAPQRLLGFLQTSWQPTLEECRKVHVQAIEQVRKAKTIWGMTTSSSEAGAQLNEGRLA